jgi:integrase
LRQINLAGAAQLELVSGVVQLRPEDAMVEAMLRGWRAQQIARGLHDDTIVRRERLARGFLAYSNEFPWRWVPAHVDEWTLWLTSKKHLAPSTIRNYQMDLRAEARPFTREEIQRFLDYADEQVDRAVRAKRKGALAAYRDATLFKVLYGWGRRTEASKLDVVDFGRNPAAPEFGRYGTLNVRYGKAKRGQPPRRRNVASLMGWAVDAVIDCDWKTYAADVSRRPDPVESPIHKGK